MVVEAYYVEAGNSGHCPIGYVTKALFVHQYLTVDPERGWLRNHTVG